MLPPPPSRRSLANRIARRQVRRGHAAEAAANRARHTHGDTPETPGARARLRASGVREWAARASLRCLPHGVQSVCVDA